MTTPDLWQTVTAAGILVATVSLAVVTALLYRATFKVADRTAALAEGTAGLVEATGKLASETAELVQKTAAANALADKHHQEALLPVLVARKVQALTSTGEKDMRTLSELCYRLAADIRNVGSGTAIDVRIIELTIDGSINPEHPYQEIDAIASGETITLERAIGVRQYMGGRSKGVAVPVHVTIMYGSIFGSTGTLAVDSNGPDDIRCKLALPTAVTRDLPGPEKIG